MKKWIVFLTLFAMSGFLSAQHSHHSSETAAVQIIFSKGVVKAIDLENKKVTIEHDAIAALSWPAMTMRFAFLEEGLVKNLKADESVNFSFITQGNAAILQTITPLR